MVLDRSQSIVGTAQQPPTLLEQQPINNAVRADVMIRGGISYPTVVPENPLARYAQENFNKVLASLFDSLKGATLTSAPSSQPTTAGFAETIRSVLTPDAQGNIHEEQFQHGIAVHLLSQISTPAADAYQAAVATYLGNSSYEDAVKAALGDVVQQGLLTQEQAERINGLSFRAAQLDGNLDTLFDGKGGAGDDTIAVLPMEEAITKALTYLNLIDNGEEELTFRPLTAPSNIKGASTTSSSSSVGGGGISQAFLWKPVSEKDGKLVVLLPAKYRGEVRDIGIYSALPPSSSTLVERGRHTGGGHMGRDHFRFNKSGGSYPDNSHVVATLTNGEQVTFKIGESSARNEIK